MRSRAQSGGAGAHPCRVRCGRAGDHAGRPVWRRKRSPGTPGRWGGNAGFPVGGRAGWPARRTRAFLRRGWPGGWALTRSPGRLPSPSGPFWATGLEGPPPGVRWPPASRGMRTQRRSARPTSAPGRWSPGGGTMRSAAWCACTASSATRGCGPPVRWCRASTEWPVGPAGTPVTRGRAGSAPCGQHCRRGARVCGAARTGRAGHACSRRWPPAATAGTRRHPARPPARPAAGPARGQQVPAVPGTAGDRRRAGRWPRFTR